MAFPENRMTVNNRPRKQLNQTNSTQAISPKSETNQMNQHFSTVFCCLLISAVASAAEQTVKGKIKSVDATKNSIKLDELELDVSRKTTITINGKAAKLADIKPDQQAKVVYEDGLDAAISIAVGEEATRDFEADAKVLKALQGEWKCIAGEENGNTQDKGTVKKQNRRVTIKGNSLTVARTGGNGTYGTYVGKFEIDQSNGHFDWIGKSDSNLVEWIGIYELDGDVLKLCFIYQKDGKAKRPKNFKSLPLVEPGMHHVSFTFKRDTE